MKTNIIKPYSFPEIKSGFQICLDCGHRFEAGEQALYREEHGELMDGCPVCLGAYETAESCAECGGYFLEDDLFPGGLCRSCLAKKIDSETAVKYITGDYSALYHFARWLAETEESHAER